MGKGELIGRGRTAEVYAWGPDRVLKLFQAWMSAEAVEHEYRMTRAASAAGLPVPAADELVEMDGRPGIIFERVEGPSMLKLFAAQPWRLPIFGRQLGELHARVHACALPADFPTQRQQIENGILRSKDMPEAFREAALSALAQLPDGEQLCHGDFHPDNILMTSRGPVLIDWITATRGNALADVCRTLMIFQTSGFPPGYSPFLRLLGLVFRKRLEVIYQKRYLQLHPAGPGQIEAWLLPVLAARLVEVPEYPQEKQVVLARMQALLSKSAT